MILVCFGGGSLGGKSREIAGNPEFPAKTKKGGVRSTLLEVLCCLYSTTRGKLSFGFFPILPQFFFFFCFQFVDVVPFNPKRRTQNVMAGGVQFHHTISTLLSQRDLKKKKKKILEKGRKKGDLSPPNTLQTHHARGETFPQSLGVTSSATRVASRQVKDNAWTLIVVHTGRIGRRITTSEYSVRGFTPQGILHTQRSGRAGGIHTQHTLETHTDSAGTVLSLCLLRTQRCEPRSG